MPGKNVEIAVEQLHINGHVRDGLCAVEEHLRAIPVRDFDHFSGRRDRAESIRHMGKRYEARPRSDQLREFVDSSSPSLLAREEPTTLSNQLIATRDFLRFHSTLEKSSDEVEDAVDDLHINNHSTKRGYPSMKRTYFPGITDVVVVTDPVEIRTISNDSRFDRDFIGHVPVRNALRLRKMLRIFSLNGRLFPTMRPRTDTKRAAAQDELWAKLNREADETKRGPVELEPLAEWVKGIGSAEKLGLLVQQSIGRLFVETFTATEESWAAACMVLEAASSSSVTKMLWWRISGRLERAKTLLASMVNGDLAAVNGISVALHHVVDGLHKMRQLAANPTARSSMTTDAAVAECLFAPTTVVRQAKTSGEVAGCPFKRGSLFILGLGSASKGGANRDLVFLSQSWSRCPAEKWVPALLEGVWTRVFASLHASEKPRGASS